MQIKQTFTMSRTEVAAFREQVSQVIVLLKPLAAELMGEQKTEVQATKLLEQLKTSITVDVKVANNLQTVSYLLRLKNDVEVILAVNIDDEVFTELMAYGVDLLKDYMSILKTIATLVINLKELRSDGELSSSRRLTALKERMGKDEVSVEIDGNEQVTEDDITPYPYWSITEGGVIKDVMDIGLGSDITDIEAKLIELSLSLPKKTFLLEASARTRLVVKGGEILKTFKFEDFYIIDNEHKREAEIFNNLIPASHDGMGNFKTK